jgi:hypothetical protein
MATTDTQLKSGQGFAYSQTGNVVNVNWPAAQRLHAQKRAFIHKPLKLQTPSELMKLQGFDSDDNGPEAA